jgi:hypothetical protein
VAWVGATISQSIATQSTAKDYVVLAIGILRVDPKDAPNPDPLRDWAVEVLQEKAPVKLSPAAVALLKHHPLLVAVETSSATAHAEAVRLSPSTTPAPSTTP